MLCLPTLMVIYLPIGQVYHLQEEQLMIKIWTIMTLVAMGFFVLGYWSAVDDRRKYVRSWRSRLPARMPAPIREETNDNDE